MDENYVESISASNLIKLILIKTVIQLVVMSYICK